jgi:hypothetical protein
MTEIVLFIVALVILLEGVPKGTREEQIARMKANIADLEDPKPGKNMVFCNFAASATRRECEKLERELEGEKRI